MRADRLVSLVLLLRQRGRMTADQLASELEVSSRTVLRDIEALSSAGVPVYAERGRHGGFSLLPGFRTELTGLNHDEALALLTAGATRGETVFGLGAALAAAMRKVLDALPEGHRVSVDDAARRLLVEPERDLLSRRHRSETLAPGVMSDVRRAVLTGRRLRFEYTSPDSTARMRSVDPIGLVTVRDRTYLLASRNGADRTYRLSRMSTTEVLDEPACRPDRVDLDRMWVERSARFLADDHLDVTVTVAADRHDELLDMVRAVRSIEVGPGGVVRADVTFDDLRHAVWAIWRLGTGAHVHTPESLRTALRDRATSLAEQYRSASPTPDVSGC
jgi:predicted DNA-binding transcriptional regulator YafY